MINRKELRCQTCRQLFVGRFGVGSGTLPFIFQCPLCGVSLRATMKPDPESRELNWESEDTSVEEQLDPGVDLLTVTVHADLPVLKAVQGLPATEALESPFIHFFGLVGGEEMATLMQSIEAMRAMRATVYPNVRRAAAHVASGDFLALEAAVERLPAGESVEGHAAMHPLYRFGRHLDLLYLPFTPFRPRMIATGELGALLLAAENYGDGAGSAQLEQLIQRPDWATHGRRVVETTVAVLGLVEALMPALAWEQVDDSKVDVDDYLIMRDDFAALKGAYQDIFELGSRSLAFLGPILNLTQRDDSEAAANGKSWTLEKALLARAVDREFILGELPFAAPLYDGIDRHTRNRIGHHLIAYDFATQTLQDDQGAATNYLLFLADFLGAARFSAYLLTVFEKVTLHGLQAAVPQRVEAGLPIVDWK